MGGGRGGGGRTGPRTEGTHPSSSAPRNGDQLKLLRVTVTRRSEKASSAADAADGAPGARDPVYAVRMCVSFPPRRGSIVVQIKFAATFSESVVPSKSGVLGVGTKQEKNPGHRAGRPGAPPEEARSHARPPLLTCLYIACVPLCSETATPCVAEHNVWTIFKNSSVISQGVRTPRSSQPRGWARRGFPDDVG